jgi:hypothetical protein
MELEGPPLRGKPAPAPEAAHGDREAAGCAGKAGMAPPLRRGGPREEARGGPQPTETGSAWAST